MLFTMLKSGLGTINPSAKQTAALIFFHGSGDSGSNLKEWVTVLHKNFALPHVKVVYPTAKPQPYTPAGGQLSNVWFDRAGITIHVPELLDSIKNAKKVVDDLIKKENDDGIPNNRIIIGGFSMGGALALYTGYVWHPDVAGVFAFGSFLNKNSFVYEELKNSSKMKPPLLQIHGNSDDIVDLSWAQETFNEMKACGIEGEFFVFDGLGHSINRKGLEIIKDWIEKLLPINKIRT